MARRERNKEIIKETYSSTQVEKGVTDLMGEMISRCVQRVDIEYYHLASTDYQEM